MLGWVSPVLLSLPYLLVQNVYPYFILLLDSTFMGIAIHNATSTDGELESLDLAAGIRQDASGILGTTVQMGDLVSSFLHHLRAVPTIFVLLFISEKLIIDLSLVGHPLCSRRVPLHRSCRSTTHVCPPVHQENYPRASA